MTGTLQKLSPGKREASGLLPFEDRGSRNGESLRVALLTGGGDKPYALGMGRALVEQGLSLDFIGSDDLQVPDLLTHSRVNFLNLRRDQDPNLPVTRKIWRLAAYYARLIRYAAAAKPKIFHILWNNKIQLFDRTLLMLYYRLLGKKIVFTAHNVNAAKRDRKDSFLNRFSLKIQYRLCDHIFVHTEKMKQELSADFAVPQVKATVIPFGINNTLPNTSLNTAQAREALGLGQHQKVLLFFGRIAPYKGLNYLILAVSELIQRDKDYRLIVAGTIKNCPAYWDQIQDLITRTGTRAHLIEKIGFIPDEQVETYFKAADVSILPYTDIFQSGVLFLGYSFGLPVIATDVGSFRNDIVEGKTGFVCRPRDARELVDKIDAYFESELFKNLESRRHAIRDYANKQYSWTSVGVATRSVYSQLLSH